MDDLQQKKELALLLLSDKDFRRQAILITQGEYIDEFTPEFEDIMFYCTPRDGKISVYASRIFNEAITLAITEQASLEDLIKLYGETPGNLLHSYLELTRNVMLTMITSDKKYKRVMNKAN